MKKKEFVVNTCDNYFLLLDKKTNKIISQRFKSIKEDELIDSSLFIDELNELLKKNKIHIPLFGWKLLFIKRNKLNDIIKEKYREILLDYCHKIEFKNIEEILNFEKEKAYMCITNTYIDYYFMKKNKVQSLRLYIEIFNNNYDKAISYLITSIYKPKKIIVFGSHEEIPKFAEFINRNFNISITFPEFHTNYVIEKYKK